jgi:hypothetical protein
LYVQMQKKKDQVLQAIHQKQQMKVASQHQQDPSGMGNGNASSQETLPMSQHSSVSPSPTMLSAPSSQHQQYMQMNMAQYGHPSQQHPSQQHPQYNTYTSAGNGMPSVPIAMSGGYVPPQQGQPHLTPVSQMGGQGAVHGSNSLPNMHHPNIPGIHSNAGAGMAMPSGHLLGGVANNNNSSNAGNTMIYNNAGLPPRAAPNFTPGAPNSNPMMNMHNQQAMLAAQMNRKNAAAGVGAGNKRSAGAAGMDPDGKAGKKKGPQQLAQQPGLGQFRPGMQMGPGQQGQVRSRACTVLFVACVALCRVQMPHTTRLSTCTDCYQFSFWRNGC